MSELMPMVNIILEPYQEVIGLGLAMTIAFLVLNLFLGLLRGR